MLYVFGRCRAIRQYLRYRRWRASLTRGERIRLDYWGATGNPDHTFKF